MKNGFVIYESQTIVAIATGLVSPTSNRKTGHMLQIWILVRDIAPVRASRLGIDRLVCGTCPHRHSSGGGCYVNLGQAPQQVFKAYHRGAYHRLDQLPLMLKAVKQYRFKIRWGAYGDPALIPLETVQALNNASQGWTGYTHQWSENPQLAGIFMASVDSLAEQAEAQVLGFRTFRVSKPEERPLRNEMFCPAPYLQCSACMRCNGQGKNIVIPAHGSRAKRVIKSLEVIA